MYRLGLVISSSLATALVGCSSTEDGGFFGGEKPGDTDSDSGGSTQAGGTGADATSATSGSDASSGSDGAGTTAMGTTTGVGSSTGEGTTDTTGGVVPPRMDLGWQPPDWCDPATDPECDLCEAVDVLFVIDNSISMDDHQIALGQAFPEFADVLVQALPPSTSIHVGVTSTEVKRSNLGNTSNCIATGDGGLPQEDFFVTPDVEDTGVNGAQGRLFVADGKPFYEIDTDASATELQGLKDWFSEASHIGDSGSQIEMAAAGAGLVAHPHNLAGPNAGFIRDQDAVLVVFFVGDEPDQSPHDIDGVPGGTAMLNMLAAAKPLCGGAQCIVGGGFVDSCGAQGLPIEDFFAGMAELPVTEELPATSTPDTFIPVLRDTLVQIIATTCGNLPPS